MSESEKTMMDRLWWQARSEVFEEENDKLRELAYKAWKAAEQLCLAFEGPCSGDSGFHGPCPMGERDGECIYGQLRRELRELGVEVD